MGQNRKDGQSSLRRINFDEELLLDQKIERMISIKEVLVVSAMTILIVIRELFHPSHLYLFEIINN